MRRLTQIVEPLLIALRPILDIPYVVFGHSMGAVLGAEMVRRMHQLGDPLPQHLLVSSRRPAHLPDERSPLHVLDAEDFLDELDRRYGGVPAEIRAEPELLALLLPSLRADIEALETFQPGLREPLPVPITVLGGELDVLVPASHLQAWRCETVAGFRMKTFAGSHFYIDSHRAELLALLSSYLTEAQDTVEGAVHG